MRGQVYVVISWSNLAIEREMIVQVFGEHYCRILCIDGLKDGQMNGVKDDL